MTYKSMNKNEIKIQLLKISADNTFGVHYISKLMVQHSLSAKVSNVSATLLLLIGDLI